MVQNPPEDFPRITPYLLYEDVDAAVDWLTSAFGFTEKMRLKGDDGRANHAEIALADGVVMLGCPGADYQNPKRLGGVTQLVHVYVDEIDRQTALAPLEQALRALSWGVALLATAMAVARLG